MVVGGLLGAAGQILMNTALVSDKPKTNTAAGGASFLSAAREVAESMTGKIVVSNGSNISELRFKKDDFEIENEMPEGIDTVYDFIAEIRKLLKEKK